MRTRHQQTPLCIGRAQQALSELLLRFGERVAGASNLEPESLEGRPLAAEKVTGQSPDAALGVDGFAAAAGLSRSRFTAVYQTWRGMNPGALLRRERTQLATELLARERLSVIEEGARVGYPDVRAFGRAFRALHGATPTAWRSADARTRDYAHLAGRCCV